MTGAATFSYNKQVDRWFSFLGGIVVGDYMKKRVTLIVLVFAFIIFNSYEIASAKKIIAHYMPWYQSQPVSGFWGWHWTMEHFHPPSTYHSHYNPPTTYASQYHPLFGPYDSSDPHVLASQALLMKFGGMDGMIADWYGIENFYDYILIFDATNHFIPYIKEAGLEFSICYEDQTVGIMLDAGHFANRAAAVAHGVQVMEWLEANYFNDTAYTKIDNRPVLLCFGPQFFTDAEWTTLFSVLTPKPHFFPLQYHLISYPTRTGEFSWPGPQLGTTPSSPTSSTKIINDLTNFYNRGTFYHWEHYIDGAFPRFHDIYAEAGVGSSYGYIDDQYAAFGSTYSYTLERSLQSSSDIVQLITWNDYGEGTIIEPTEEDGYLYLEITQQVRKQYIDPNFPYTAENLRLPVRLYTLRKENLSNPTVMSQLASVEDFLFAGNLSVAEDILDEIECIALHVFTSAWLNVPENGNWNPACDFSLPTDNIIDFQDFAVFAVNWLNGTHF